MERLEFKPLLLGTKMGTRVHSFLECLVGSIAPRSLRSPFHPFDALVRQPRLLKQKYHDLSDLKQVNIARNSDVWEQKDHGANMDELWVDLYFWFIGGNILIFSAVQVRGMAILCPFLSYKGINVVHENSTALTQSPFKFASSVTMKI